MNKVYIVEMYSFDEYKRYGIFAKFEDAKKMLVEVYNKEKQFYEDMHDDIEVVFVSNDKFVLKFEGRIHNDYIIKEEKVQ